MLKQLIAFIKAQPADRVIDHTSWHSCAVGDFAREVLVTDIPKFDPQLDAECLVTILYADPTLRKLFADCGSNRWRRVVAYGCEMHEDPSFMDIISTSDVGDTYGALQQFLEVSPY
jgi:hypothetical protein